MTLCKCICYDAFLKQDARETIPPRRPFSLPLANSLLGLFESLSLLNHSYDCCLMLLAEIVRGVVGKMIYRWRIVARLGLKTDGVHHREAERETNKTTDASDRPRPRPSRPA